LDCSGSNEGCRDDVNGDDWPDERKGVVCYQWPMINYFQLLSFGVLESGDLGSGLFITKNDSLFLKFAIRSGLDEDGFC
jgi:hypothetical protein